MCNLARYAKHDGERETTPYSMMMSVIFLDMLERERERETTPYSTMKLVILLDMLNMREREKQHHTL